MYDQFLIDLAMALGLIDGKILYGDGTILKAWCNTFKTMYPYEIEYLKNFMTTNSSNEEIWNKLKRYYLDDEEDDKLKDELSNLINEFNYKLNSNRIHLLQIEFTIIQ